jgi:transposase
MGEDRRQSSGFKFVPWDIGREAAAMVRPEFPIFEMVVVQRRRRRWAWSVRTSQGAVVAQGRESSRPAAKYQAERALFMLLLTAVYRSRLPV